MAKPIKETPVLTGEDAQVFREKMKASDAIRVNKKERVRVRENFSKMHAIANF